MRRKEVTKKYTQPACSSKFVFYLNFMINPRPTNFFIVKKNIKYMRVDINCVCCCTRIPKTSILGLFVT